MTDIVERLRVYTRFEHPKNYETHIVWQAADEIERLREALLEIAEGDRPDNEEQFCVGYWGATARAVLEGKKE
jgi:hypothetical protein